MAVVEPGAGLVFRYADPENFWAVTAADGEWAVLRATDGRVDVAGTIPMAPTDGTTLSVSQTEQRLQIFVDGDVGLELLDRTHASQRRSGLITPADGSGAARFDRFFVGDLPA
jgi:hypothetical protein